MSQITREEIYCLLGCNVVHLVDIHLSAKPYVATSQKAVIT
jgi:hypothetical protein